MAEQHEGKTEKSLAPLVNQQQEPEPSRDATMAVPPARLRRHSSVVSTAMIAALLSATSGSETSHSIPMQTTGTGMPPTWRDRHDANDRARRREPRLGRTDLIEKAKEKRARKASKRRGQS
jgi:hypothetical protein